MSHTSSLLIALGLGLGSVATLHAGMPPVASNLDVAFANPGLGAGGGVGSGEGEEGGFFTVWNSYGFTTGAAAATSGAGASAGRTGAAEAVS